MNKGILDMRYSLFLLVLFVRFTAIKVKSEWVYLYRRSSDRAIDKFGNTIDFMLSRKRDKSAATRFFAQAIGHTGIPR
jgi:putative transposase